jgi:hypothetical protein
MYTPVEYGLAPDSMLCRQEELATLSVGQSICLEAACHSIHWCVQQAANKEREAGRKDYLDLPEAIMQALEVCAMTAVHIWPF